MSTALSDIIPDQIFDGGDLDCGSGLILLIRENMLKTPMGGILEMRSREPTVASDLPPWCQMVGHEYLGSLQGPGYARYFLRRLERAEEEEKELQEDRQKAKEYTWRARARATGPLKSTVYARNFSFDLGQPASFEQKDKHPSAVEYLLGALAGSLTSGFASECARDNLEIDDIEITIKGRLKNVLAHLGLEEGDAAFESIDVQCFASTFAAGDKVRNAWERTVARSPVAATLNKAVALKIKLAIV